MAPSGSPPFGVAVVVRPVSAVARTAGQAQRRSTEPRVRVIRLQWSSGTGVLGTTITEGLTEDWQGTVRVGIVEDDECNECSRLRLLTRAYQLKHSSVEASQLEGIVSYLHRSSEANCQIAKRNTYAK